MICPFCGNEAWPAFGLYLCIGCASKNINGRWHKRMHCGEQGCPGWDAEVGESSEAYAPKQGAAYTRFHRTGSEENWR